MNKMSQIKNRVYTQPLSRVFTISFHGVIATSGEDFNSKDLAPVGSVVLEESDS